LTLFLKLLIVLLNFELLLKNKIFYKNIRLCTNLDVSLDTSVLIGKGEHGAVYSGNISNRKENVAVKTTCLSLSVSSAKRLLTEIKILIHVGNHENVINFIGAYTAEKFTGNVSIILEFCELGSLINVLRQPERQFSILFSKDAENHG